MAVRTFDIIGQATADASVLVDNNTVFTGKINGTKLFTFTTDVRLHGKVKVEIKVRSGSIKIQKCLVTYPALINGVTTGGVQFDQPIKHPMVTEYNGNLLTIEEAIITDYFCYDHLMFNGPTIWNIQTTNEIDMPLGSIIKLKNIKEFGTTLVTKIVPDWGYEHKKEEINKFKEELYES